VGKAVPGTEVKLAADGEILTKGPHIFKGYWNQPDKTAETIIDGWLHSGDIGFIDNEGWIKITGRKKDIIITAGGKNITPSEIENGLKFSPYIQDAVVIGDQKKFLSCLIMVDQENVAKFAQDERIPFSDFASLCAAKEVVELIKGEVDKVNRDFARVEQIKAFRLIDRLILPEDDEITATGKLKRGFVSKKYKALIDEMY
jgi:long-chain acyl-CoA synthetase